MEVLLGILFFMDSGHRKRLKHFEQVRHLHELTFSCDRRMPLLTNDAWLSILAQSLDCACSEEEFQLIAFVFMPEHVHLLVLPMNSAAKVRRLLGKTKQPTSKRIREILEADHSPLLEQLIVHERPGKSCFRFWQPGAGFDRNLFSPQAIAAAIDYTHGNPVKRNLCHRATDFKWSSARFHLQNVIDPDLPKLVRLDPEWFHSGGIQVEKA